MSAPAFAGWTFHLIVRGKPRPLRWCGAVANYVLLELKRRPSVVLRVQVGSWDIEMHRDYILGLVVLTIQSQTIITCHSHGFRQHLFSAAISRRLGRREECRGFNTEAVCRSIFVAFLRCANLGPPQILPITYKQYQSNPDAPVKLLDVRGMSRTCNFCNRTTRRWVYFQRTSTSFSAGFKGASFSRQ